MPSYKRSSKLRWRLWLCADFREEVQSALFQVTVLRAQPGSLPARLQVVLLFRFREIRLNMQHV